MRIDAYRNLHKPGCKFSLRAKGKVFGYADTVVLQGVTMKHASPKQLEAVRTKCRQVCQWLKGEWLEGADVSTDGMKRLACDPKKANGFCDSETGERVDSASVVVLNSSGAYYKD